MSVKVSLAGLFSYGCGALGASCEGKTSGVKKFFDIESAGLAWIRVNHISNSVIASLR